MSARVVAALRPFKSRNFDGEVEPGTSVRQMLEDIGATVNGLEYYVSIDSKPIHPDFWDVRAVDEGELVCVRAMASGGGRPVGGKNPRAILGNLLVGAAAFAIPGTGFWIGMARLGTVAIGGWMVGQLAPPPMQDKFPGGDSAGVNVGNALAPYATVPYLCGTHLIHPPHSVIPWHDTRNRRTVVLYTLGHGPISIDETTLKFGDRLISDAGISTNNFEVREGRPDDDPRTIFPPMVVENVVDVDMEAGIYTPAGLFTALDVHEISVNLKFPYGVYATPDEPVPAGYDGETSTPPARLRYTVRVRRVVDPPDDVWYSAEIGTGDPNIHADRVMGTNGKARADSLRVILAGERTTEYPYKIPGGGQWEVGIRYVDESPYKYDVQWRFAGLSQFVMLTS